MRASRATARRAEAVLVDGTGPGASWPDAGALVGAVDRASRAGLHVACAATHEIVATNVVGTAPRSASGAVVVRVDPDRAVARATQRLWELGVGPELIATVRPEDALHALAEQVELRASRALPAVARIPGWCLVVDGVDRRRERVREALLNLANGRVGTSGAPVWRHESATGDVVIAGVYDGEGPETDLLPAPRWHLLGGTFDDDDIVTRVLDLRSGVLAESIDDHVRLESVRFVSLARPTTVALRASARGGGLDAGAVLTAPHGRAPRVGTGPDGRVWMVVDGTAGSIAAAGVQRHDPKVEVVDRIVVYTASIEGAADPDAALVALDESERLGFDELLAEHRAAWAERWEHADVVIDGDDELCLATRVSLFHLMSSVASDGDAAVGARGLSGHAYRGHVFWDADTFVLPFVAATHPASARAMLEYRVRRLPAALAAAQAQGAAGARFPWESAATGFDVTPTSGRDQAGRIVPIRTGEAELHVVAEVAWSVAEYLAWTGDAEFAAGDGHRLLVETARFWASRIRLDTAGRGHLYGVIGPDEYHETVDDNAFTNLMARWNLRRAASSAQAHGGVGADERVQWLELAAALIDGYDAVTGVYEQFAGFFQLEPLVIAEVAPQRPITADLLLGRERVQGAQVIKQADVLMAHHLLPDDVETDSLEPNLEYYEPRTAHGSSLSPGIHAALFARAGRLDEAVEALRIAAFVDLHDVTGTSAGGLHLATMGSVWQTLVFGFAGLRPRGDALTLDPRLPAAWEALEVRVRFRGVPVRIRMEHDATRVDTDRPLDLWVGGELRRCEPGGWVLPGPAT